MPDYTDVVDLHDRARARTQSPAQARLRDIQRQAAERMARLLDQDEWATFRVLAQGFVDEAEAGLAMQREAIESGRLVGDALAVAVNAARDYRVQIDAYQRVLALPREVVEAAPKEA